jgi:hypothetical protein
VTDEPRPRPHRSTAPAGRAADDIRHAQSGSAETQRQPAPASGEAQRPEGAGESRDERVRTPVGADEHPHREVSTAHGAVVHEGGHVDDHSDTHMAAEHAEEAHMLGPIDVPAWTAAAAGIAIALLVAFFFYVAIS